jgi:tripartite-type tricarboxylate transporter receptor subunit TctC
MKLMKFFVYSLFAFTFSVVCAANAQPYPNRAITIVVPFPAGGLTDTPVRLLAQMMQEKLNVPVVVENKPGGSGVIGASYVLRSEPDGYTLLANAVADTQNLFYMKIPYNAVKDFTAIAKIVDGPPLVLLVNAKMPYKSVADVVADAKARPDGVSFGTSGYATSPFIALKELNDVAGTNIVAVPYHGAGEAATSLMSGSIQGTFTAFSSGKSLVDSGQVRALAVAGPKRLDAWPNVPTMQESGFKDFDYNAFVGLAAPAKTPPEAIAFLNKTVNDIIHTDVFKSRMNALNMTIPEAADNTPEKFTAFFAATTERQGRIAKLAKGGKPATP